jgi:biopolymer transport protein ExbD
MRVPHSHHGRGSLDISMTPMIDVVFQLLIFFICTASFQEPEELLPTQFAVSAGTTDVTAVETEPALERVLVRATRRGEQTEWIVNERPCPNLMEVRLVLSEVAQIDRSLPVILDVDNEIPLGDMIDVYDLCRLVGFEKIQFAASR